MEKPVRVLHIVGAMYPGGMENFIMNLYQRMDREKVQFDIAVHMRRENDYVERIREMGGIVYELPRLTRKPLSNLRQLYRIVKDNRYRVVIRHTSNALVAPQLLAARMAGACTICHSHTETDPQQFVHRLGRLMMGISAKEKFACSEKAGQWMYGKKKFRVINNAIDIRKFSYKPEAAERIKREFGLGDGHIYGHIGNLCYPKNHRYLVSVYKELSELDPEAVFFCVGDGELRAEVEEEIKRLGMEGRIILTGTRKDAEAFMSCFHVMIFPSRFEGLPLTLIEAQAAGLQCLISDHITQGVVVTDGLVERMSIEEEPKAWAARAFAMANFAAGNSKSRECQYTSIAKAGYDMETLAKWYEEYFLKLAL